MKYALPLLLLLGLLSACGGILPKAREPNRLFVLHAPALEMSGKTPLAETLEVVLPQAAAGLDGDRIALLKNPNEIDFYADARWAEPLPLLAQSLLVEGFERQGQIKTVGNDMISLAPTLRLVVELRNFEAMYAGDTKAPPTVHVRLVSKLFREPAHQLLHSQSYEEYETATGNEFAAIIPAFDTAFGRATTRMLSDIVDHAQ